MDNMKNCKKITNKSLNKLTTTNIDNNLITLFNALDINDNKKENKTDNKEDNKDNKKDNKEENNKTVTLDYINKRIDKECCIDTINILKDNNLIDEYKQCKSVKNKIKKLESVLDKHNINLDKKNLIINDYILDLIPAGTKGVIRGNKFNNIIKETINKFNLDKDNFEVCFEKKCKLCFTTEIPDWYILQKSTNKIIIGMNQLDLWGGGQQINRGFKYLINNKHNTDKTKLLCVICNKVKLKSNKSKTYQLFESGYLNNTLCYLKNLESIIKNYFNL